MKDLLFNIFQRQKAEKIEIIKYNSVVRDIAASLQKSLGRKLIKAVIGPRRSGKSSLIHHVLTESRINYAYLNFEDEQLPESVEFEEIDQTLNKVYTDFDLYFFDEIQVYPRWEQLLNRLERTGKRVVISGSNSKLLGSELASSLTGRHELIEVLPFNLGEFKQAQLLKEETGNSDQFQLLKKYLRSGGFPDVVMNRVNERNYLRELWDSIILKDIVQRYRIRSVTELKALLGIFKDSIASPVGNRSLERSLLNRLSIATIGKFLVYAEGAYLAFSLQNFSFKARQRVSSDKKAYIIDNGFYTSTKVGGQDDFGRLLENLVFVNIMSRRSRPNLDLFYYKTKSGKEVDFLTLKNGKPNKLIQVAWSLGAQKTLDRERNALIEAATELDVKSLLIVTAQEKAAYKYGNMEILALPFAEYSGFQ